MRAFLLIAALSLVACSRAPTSDTGLIAMHSPNPCGVHSSPTFKVTPESVFRSPPLKVEIAIRDNVGIKIKNTAQIPLIISKRSLDQADVLWFIKINDRTISSSVVAVIDHEEEIAHRHKVEALVLAKKQELNQHDDFIVLKEGEEISWLVNKRAFIDSGFSNISRSVSEKTPLDLTVSLTDPIVGYIDNAAGVKLSKGRLIVFSDPIKVSRLPEMR